MSSEDKTETTVKTQELDQALASLGTTFEAIAGGSKDDLRAALLALEKFDFVFVMKVLTQFEQRQLLRPSKAPTAPTVSSQFAELDWHWAYRFRGFDLPFVPPPMFDQQLDYLQEQALLESTSVKKISYFLIEGMSGAGKTFVATELLRRLRLPPDRPLFRTFHRMSHNSFEGDNEHIGLKWLLYMAIFNHASEDSKYIPWIRDLSSAMLRKLLADVFGSALELQLDTPRPTKIRAVWCIAIDDAASYPEAARATLRAIRSWNDPDHAREDPDDMGCRPMFGIFIIPVVVTVSSYRFNVVELVQATHYKPHHWILVPTLLPAFADGLLAAALKAANVTNFAQRYLSVVAADCSGWPFAFSCIADAITKYHAHRKSDAEAQGEEYKVDPEEEFDYDAALFIYSRVFNQLTEAYRPSMYTNEFGGTLSRLLSLAVTELSVSPAFRLNGKTLEEALDSGLFTLERTQIPCQLPQSSAFGSIVRMPTLVLWHLNEAIHGWDTALVNPFDHHWSTFEGVALSSLFLRINALRTLGFTSATLSELRPGANMHPETMQRRVTLPPLGFDIPTVTHCFMDSDTSCPLSHIPVGTEGKQHRNLLKGGILRCCENEALIDGICSFPAEPEAPLLLFSQHKAQALTNRQGAIPESKLKRGDVGSTAHAVLKHYHEHLTADPVPEAVIEFISDKALPPYSPPPGVIVVSESNWGSCVGPVFRSRLQVLRTFRADAPMKISKACHRATAKGLPCSGKIRDGSACINHRGQLPICGAVCYHHSPPEASQEMDCDDQ